jgi:hypothetical protein
VAHRGHSIKDMNDWATSMSVAFRRGSVPARRFDKLRELINRSLEAC